MTKLYTLLSAVGEPYKSAVPGALGGNSKLRIYGRLDCPSANRYLDRGYARIRVFFASVEDAVAAGYRPCGICMRAEYQRWKAEQTAPAAQDEAAALMEPDDELGDSHSSDAYRRALEAIVPLSDTHRRLLSTWISKEGGWATPSELASILGYDSMNRANIDVGSLGHLIVKVLGLDDASYRDPDGSRSRYWAVYCDLYRQGRGWHLSEAFVEAARPLL